MAENQGRVIPVAIEDEVKASYLNYAMSVIVARALPDVRDGLKPVHRRILYGMSEMGLRSDRAPKKAARIVGDVLGRYHPHGDASVYDALVRMAQDFSLRYPLVNGQGNFGSVDGDPPAAMRYTEARLHKIAEEMLRDIKKETVDFVPNYDDSMTEPSVLPAALPQLLVNGASGIAVGMATNIPPHNLNEIARAIAAYIDNPDISIDELCTIVEGPDFPTAGIIYGRAGIREAYHTGHGKVVVRARVTMESNKQGKDVIIVNEIPYQVNKAVLVTRIADLIRDKKIDGITDLRDESDRNGMRVVMELRRGASPKIILNQLFSHTQLQVNFNVNALALVDGRPQVLNLKDMIVYFVRHRREVVVRRTQFDLRKAEERAHILQGLKIALENIDEVIAIIKESVNVDTARNRLMERFALTEVQSQAILDMRLQRLTSLETQKIIDELREVLALIEELKALLASEAAILGVVRSETIDIAERFGDARKTEVVNNEVEQINIEDLIHKEDMVVLISHRGYMKRVPLTAYRTQGRGGKGSSSTNLKEDDFIAQIFIASTHAHIVFVSTAGKAYWVKVHEIPEGSRNSRGQHIKSILAINANEEVAAVVELKAFSKETFIFLATAKGMVKKVVTSDFVNAKTRGIIGIGLDDDDKVVSALLTSGTNEVFLVTRQGQGLKFAEEEVRAMGRAARGVVGIRFKKSGDEVAAAVPVTEDADTVLYVTSNGAGKRTKFDEFLSHGRGTRGQTAYRIDDRTGEIVGALAVNDDDTLVFMTSQGNTIRLPARDVSVQGRDSKGVRVVNIDPPDFVVGLDRSATEESEAEGPTADGLETEEPAAGTDNVAPPEPAQ